MRALPAVLTISLAACSELPTTPPPGGGPSSLEFAMVTRIGDIRVRATDSDGFRDTLVTVGKGGFILKTTFQNAGALAHTAVTEADYELRVTGDAEGALFPERVVYTPLRGFEGSFYWVAPGQLVETWIGLWHKSEKHYDAGPYRLFIQREPHSWTERDEIPVQ